MAAMVRSYLDLCTKYSTRPSADVAIWLRLQSMAVPAAPDTNMPPPDTDMPPRENRRGWKMLAGSRCDCSPPKPMITNGLAGPTDSLVIRPKQGDGAKGFTDMDMLPLCDIFSEPPAEGAWPLEALKALDLSRTHIGRSGILLFCNTVLASPKCSIATLNLSNQKIGSTGARALAAAARANHSLKELILHNCWLRDEGGRVFAGLLAESPQSHALSLLDLSNNVIPMQTCIAIEAAVGMRMTPEGLEKKSKDLKPPACILNTDGNRVFDEVLNATSHGLALILAIVGCVFLSMSVRGRPAHYQWAIALYLTSLCALFLASTLYHSFFSLKATRIIFSVLDHSAIYLLIAGSYTPILAILFADKPKYSQGLLGVMWTLCIIGISATAILPETSFKMVLSLSLYLGMGWAAALICGDMKQRLTSIGLQMLVGGGVLYTVGVPFFIRNRQTIGVPDHTIWHMFVLAGAFTHYMFILNHIVPAVVPADDVALQP
mmetsp:Transcript_12605/g.21925  ORF Transcript_12605/g.21925 Transcript_12605/m.21925 type:complete len:490 (+) Transcript_12605:97-1566(+)